MNEDVFEANGAKFVRKDDVIIHHICSGKGDFEPATTQWIFENLKHDKAYVDIGHSTGWFAIPAALKGYEVYGFEPLPNAYTRALRNMELSDVTYNLFNCAVSSKSGKMKLTYNGRLPITSGASLEPRVPRGNESVEVDVITLDEALPSGLDVGIIKVDVEGHEIHVLEGAEKLVFQCRPKMVLEANSADKMEELANWLKSHDYSWEIKDTRNMICVPR